MTASRRTPGTTSRKSSRRFPAVSGASIESPVAFPPGRAKLAIKPAPTGSPDNANTIGMTDVARWTAGRTGAVVTMISTLDCTRLALLRSHRSVRCVPLPIDTRRLCCGFLSSHARVIDAPIQRTTGHGTKPYPGRAGQSSTRLLRTRRERPRRRAAERGQEFSSFDAACHVTLRLGVILAMEG